MAYSLKKSSRKSSSRPPIFWAALVVLALVVILIVLELTNTTHLFHKNRLASSTIPTTNSADNSSNTSTNSKSPSSSNSTSSTAINKDKSITPPSSGTEVVAPSGSLVSYHTPSVAQNTKEESVCVTSPGATCTIVFTNKDGVKKVLAATKADSNGSVTWNWKVNDAGFSAGSWKITATASLNGQTKSTSDLQDLVVQP